MTGIIKVKTANGLVDYTEVCMVVPYSLVQSNYDQLRNHHDLCQQNALLEPIGLVECSYQIPGYYFDWHSEKFGRRFWDIVARWNWIPESTRLYASLRSFQQRLSAEIDLPVYFHLRVDGSEKALTPYVWLGNNVVYLAPHLMDYDLATDEPIGVDAAMAAAYIELEHNIDWLQREARLGHERLTALLAQYNIEPGLRLVTSIERLTTHLLLAPGGDGATAVAADFAQLDARSG